MPGWSLARHDDEPTERGHQPPFPFPTKPRPAAPPTVPHPDYPVREPKSGISIINRGGPQHDPQPTPDWWELEVAWRPEKSVPARC